MNSKRGGSPAPLRVALVGAYPRTPDRVENGVEAVVCYLTQGLASLQDVELTVISTRPDVSEAYRCMQSGFAVYYLPAARHLGNLSLGLPEKRRVARLLETLAPDVVHVHNHAQYPFLYTRPPVPTITTIHGFVCKEALFERERMDLVRKVPRLLLETIVFQRVRQLIAVSSYVQAVLREKTRARVRVVDNPVAAGFFRLHTREVSGRVLFAGAITRRKNLLGLLRALAVLRPEVTNLELRVAGAFTEPSYEAEIRAFVAEQQMQNAVSFLGHLSEDALLEEYATCQIVASASHEETAGMIFQQGMAAGRAVAGTRVGGVPDVVRDGRTGLLVDPDDWHGLAKAMKLLLTNSTLRNQIGQTGKQEAVRRFRPEAVARQTCDIYRSLLESKGSSNGY